MPALAGHAENLQQAIDLTKEFAIATGTTAAEAAKKLAPAFAEVSKGALELNQKYAFLNGTTLELIRTLESQGNAQEAQRVFMGAALPAIKQQADAVGVFAGRGTLRQIQLRRGLRRGRNDRAPA